ncbi:Ig-like domain repeat protein [Demequina maris]|uniref:Ig-like domain repeat protein n=1 Tax=Demequina maris TaxID=1638982 RepID=UPI0007848C14|nr:Ig-like domain repeat protein [Demequina maris]
MTIRHLPTARTLASATVAFTLASSGLTTAAAEELPNTLDGTLYEVGFNSFDEREHAHVIVSDDGAITEVEGAVLVDVEPGATVEATLEGTEVVSVTVTDEPAATAVVTSHQAYVVTVDDATVETDVPLERATTDVETATGYWMREARGAISTFDIAGTATLALDRSCSASYTTLWSAASELFPGVAFGEGGNHLVVYTPTECTWGYAGVATVGSRMGNGYIHMPRPLSSATVHEFGHNLGLGHANLMWGDPYGDSGYAEYYAAYGPMAASVGAYAAGGLSAAHRLYLDLPGWDEQTQTLTIDPVESQTHLLTLDDTTANAGTTAITFIDPSDGFRYLLELRSGQGVDAASYYARSGGGTLAPQGYTAHYEPGVVVEWIPGGNNLQVFAQENETDHGLDTSFGAGETFTAPSDLFDLTVLSTSATTATIQLVTHPVSSTLELDAPDTYQGSGAAVTATVTSDRAPSGTISLYLDDEPFATETVADGAAVFELPSFPFIGGHELRAVYSGGDGVRASEAEARLDVLQRSWTTTTAAATTTKYGAAGRLTVTVANTSYTDRPVPTGTVTVTTGSTTWTGALVDGKATFALPKTWKPGTRTLKAVYSGSSSADPSATSATATVTKLTPKVTATAKSTIRKGSKATVVATVANAVAPESGYVQLFVGAKAVSGKVKLVTSGSVHKAKVTSTALPKGRISVKYYGNAYLVARKVATTYYAK